MAPARPAQTNGVATDTAAGLGNHPRPRPSPETLRIAYMNCNDIYDRCLTENQNRFMTSLVPNTFRSPIPVRVKSEMILLREVHHGSFPISGRRQGEGGPMSFLLSGGQQNSPTEERCFEGEQSTKRRKTEHQCMLFLEPIHSSTHELRFKSVDLADRHCGVFVCGRR